MDLLRGIGDRFVVLDVETTGVLNSDRVVEVAAVTLSPNGNVVDEWDTLVNPGRDVGPTHIHRITASMVSMAPTFGEIAGALAERLNGAVLVAHNLAFDARMIGNEFDRLGLSLEQGIGVCTLSITREKLNQACKAYDVELIGHHRALADARATSRLLRKLPRDAGDRHVAPARIATAGLTFQPRTLRRDVTAEEEAPMPYLARMADRAHHSSEHGAALVYMDLLDWALADLVLTNSERDQLVALAQDLGLSGAEVADVHQRYVDDLVEAALRDGVVDDTEQSILVESAEMLGVDATHVLQRVSGSDPRRATLHLAAGTRICFTGSATNPDGSKLDRRVLRQSAADRGLVPVNSVTRKGCDLVVASDPSSQSGKAKKARNYNIPLASVHAFLATCPDGSIPVVT